MSNREILMKTETLVKIVNKQISPEAQTKLVWGKIKFVINNGIAITIINI